MALTERQMEPVVGKTAMMAVEKWRIQVRVLDSRYVFGRQDVLVEPVSGEGRAWVDAARLTMIEEA
ncbi:MAG: hypothetical protein QJR08_04275 [Bacillota bacterium]|nr:hypothetical protein [Bacillota bacterium]